VTERDAALAAGMDAFLTKPIDADKLRATLMQFCSASETTTAAANPTHP
jgi:CheY-like chemotaxis protein